MRNLLERIKTPEELIREHDIKKIGAQLRARKLEAELAQFKQCPDCVRKKSKDIYTVSLDGSVRCPVHGASDE